MTERSRQDKVRLIRTSAANLEYFFSRVDSSWLPFLLEEGFFLNPLPPETGTTKDGQDWIRFPNWPESQYLARIAADDPDGVFEAIQRIPATANPRIHQDIVTAAMALPGELAARVATSEQQWLARYDGHLVSYPQPAGDLVAHLAEEGEIGAAFRLAGTLLKISEAPEFDSRSARRRAVALMGEWEYGKILEKAWPPMMEAEPRRAFSFLCHRLDDAIKLGIDEGTNFDPSYIWRSAIENHVQNTGNSLLDTVVDALRDTALVEAEKGAEFRDMVLEEFACHDRPLFRRLSLFVLARFGSASQMAEALADEALMDDAHVWHEYAELLRSRFADLDTAQQERIVGLIAAGPGRGLTAFQKERGVTEEEFETRRRYWRLERYALIPEYIEGDVKAEYESLLAEFGKPDHPTFRSVVTHWTGPRSPYSAEELLEMSPAGTLEVLRTWEPEGGPEDPSPEGLGRILEEAVKEDPSGFAEIAMDFANLDPDYVRGLLGGLTKAAKERKTFPWGPVLDMCERVVRMSESQPKNPDSDAPRNWLRKTMASLLSEGFNQGDAEIPPSERVRVWQILEACLEDPDPLAGRDEEHDPATVAINSVRGEALHAAVRYALWVERDLTAKDAFAAIDSLPEFAAAIERRLDPTVDRSPAIRAVLGQWFVQLVRIDEKWAESLVVRLFPASPDAANVFSAAWNAYVIFNQAYPSVFEILREVYEVAVDRFDAVDESRYMAGNPRDHLAGHLFSLRFNGLVDLSPQGIFARFWRAAPVEIRKHAIREVGWSLEHGNQELSEAFRDRIVQTWEWIFDQSDDEHEALGEFGAWFGAPQLKDEWLLAQGKRVLELNIPLDPDHVVYDSLPRMANSYPREVIEILRLMVLTDPEGWSLLGSVDEVRQTLAAVLNSGNETARSRSVAVLHLLGARGMSEFRDLLPPQ